MKNNTILKTNSVSKLLLNELIPLTNSLDKKYVMIVMTVICIIAIITAMVLVFIFRFQKRNSYHQRKMIAIYSVNNYLQGFLRLLELVLHLFAKIFHYLEDELRLSTLIFQ